MTVPTDPTARYMASLCARAYNDPPTYGAADSAGRANVYDGDVVYRGTDNLASLWADGDILVADTPLGKLHRGFWEAWLPVEGQVLALEPQRLAGHSEGAPIAMIDAGMMCLSGKPPSIVYAIACPMFCADDKLYKLLEKFGVTVFAPVNCIDPIPWVPPTLQFQWARAHIGKFDVNHFDPLWYHGIANYVTALS